jgi:DNA-binding MarR family transcriptional regulator
MMPTMTESDRAAGGGTAGSSPGAGLDGAIESVEREFGTLFVKLRNRMRVQALQLHPEIQPAGYLMLTALSRSGPMHAGALAEVLYADKSLVSRQASQLEQLGLLRREQDPADRRATYFALTDEAQKRLKQLFELNREELRSGLSGWDVEELRLFARLLHRLNEF